MSFPVKLRLRLFLTGSKPSHFSHLWNYAVKFKSNEAILLVVSRVRCIFRLQIHQTLELYPLLRITLQSIEATALEVLQLSLLSVPDPRCFTREIQRLARTRQLEIGPRPLRGQWMS